MVLSDQLFSSLQLRLTGYCMILLHVYTILQYSIKVAIEQFRLQLFLEATYLHLHWQPRLPSRNHRGHNLHLLRYVEVSLLQIFF